jgi:hypothetical protein
MPTRPTANDPKEAYVSAAFRPENVALHGDDADVQKIVAEGPRGALALAGLTVAALLALWFAFFLFIYLPRGVSG